MFDQAGLGISLTAKCPKDSSLVKVSNFVMRGQVICSLLALWPFGGSEQHNAHITVIRYIKAAHPPEKSSNFVAVFSHFFPPNNWIQFQTLECVTCILTGSLGVKFNVERYKNEIGWIVYSSFGFFTLCPWIYLTDDNEGLQVVN